jgi:hypothetical protein
MEARDDKDKKHHHDTEWNRTHTLHTKLCSAPATAAAAGFMQQPAASSYCLHSGILLSSLRCTNSNPKAVVVLAMHPVLLKSSVLCGTLG